MPTTMLQRLGQVLYWTGCAAGALLVILALASLAMMDHLSDNWPVSIGLVFVAVCLWALGRACRYVLAGT